MKHLGIILLLGLFATQCALAQKGKADKSQKSEEAIKAVINRFFEGMEKGDTSLIWGACTKEAVLQTFMADKEGNMSVKTGNFSEFVAFIGTPTANKYKEVVEFEAIHTEESLASAWTPYTFYLNGKISHCGTNSFQLVKTADGWKIQYIIDTRRKGECPDRLKK